MSSHKINERYKHIGWDFHSVPLVMPHGLGAGVKIKFSEHGHMSYQIKGGEQ